MTTGNRLYRRLGTRFRRRYKGAVLPIVRTEAEILAEIAAQVPTVISKKA